VCSNLISTGILSTELFWKNIIFLAIRPKYPQIQFISLAQSVSWFLSWLNLKRRDNEIQGMHVSRARKLSICVYVFFFFYKFPSKVSQQICCTFYHFRYMRGQMAKLFLIFILNYILMSQSLIGPNVKIN